MPHIIKSSCPCCHKRANNYDEIERLFGWRRVNGKTIQQSYCVKCRKARCTKKVPKH